MHDHDIRMKTPNEQTGKQEEVILTHSIAGTRRVRIILPGGTELRISLNESRGGGARLETDGALTLTPLAPNAIMMQRR